MSNTNPLGTVVLTGASVDFTGVLESLGPEKWARSMSLSPFSEDQ